DAPMPSALRSSRMATRLALPATAAHKSYSTTYQLARLHSLTVTESRSSPRKPAAMSVLSPTASLRTDHRNDRAPGWCAGGLPVLWGRAEGGLRSAVRGALRHLRQRRLQNER